MAVAATLLLGFVFTTTATANTNIVYAATDDNDKRKKNTGSEAVPIEDPLYRVSFEAATIVEKAFPNSTLISGERQYIPITPKQQPLPKEGDSKRLPAYIFNLVRTDERAAYEITVVVDGIAGKQIPPRDWYCYLWYLLHQNLPPNVDVLIPDYCFID